MGVVHTKAATVAALVSQGGRVAGFGATGLYIFGSAARDELESDSDVDLFIDYDPASDFSFVELMRLKALLANVLGRDVDLTTRDGLHPKLRETIERESIKVL